MINFANRNVLKLVSSFPQITKVTVTKEAGYTLADMECLFKNMLLLGVTLYTNGGTYTYSQLDKKIEARTTSNENQLSQLPQGKNVYDIILPDDFAVNDADIDAIFELMKLRTTKKFYIKSNGKVTERLAKRIASENRLNENYDGEQLSLSIDQQSYKELDVVQFLKFWPWARIVFQAPVEFNLGRDQLEEFKNKNENDEFTEIVLSSSVEFKSDDSTFY